MSKYFLINPVVENQDKEVIEKSRREKESGYRGTFKKQREQDEVTLSEEDNLKHIEGRVVVKVDVDSKDSWTFVDGTKIEYKRRFNNLNHREVSPVNAFVISGEGIEKGAQVLVHPNSIHDSNRIFDYKDANDKIRYYSIHNDMCFAWNNGKDWLPLPPYETALRVFKPYEGKITGIEPTVLKNVLFVTSGELKNKAVQTLVACDYQIVFQGLNGREDNLIRFRPNGDEKSKREEEAIAILNDVTKKILSGEYLVGHTVSDAKTFK